MNQKILRPVMLLAILISTLSYSCKKSATEDDEQILDANLIKSATKYESLLRNRGTEKGTFEITTLSRDKEILNFSIKGGCQAEDFKVVWDGQIMLSYPAQVRLVVYNTAQETCGTDKEFNLSINLKKMLQQPDAGEFIVHLANGSVKRDKSLNPDGSVSSD